MTSAADGSRTPPTKATVKYRVVREPNEHSPTRFRYYAQVRRTFFRWSYWSTLDYWFSVERAIQEIDSHRNRPVADDQLIVYEATE